VSETLQLVNCYILFSEHQHGAKQTLFFAE